MNKVAEYINNNLRIEDEYRRIFGRSMPTGKFFCPFHVNTNTPAAKHYFNGIKCFSCNKFYTVYDLLYAYDKQRIEDIKGSVVIKESQDVRTTNQQNVIFVDYNPNEDIKSILNKITTANDFEI